MKKVSTTVAKLGRDIFQQTLTVDRTWEIATAGTAYWTRPARYNGSSECVRCQKSCAKSSAESRVADLHWRPGRIRRRISRLLGELGHEVIVAHVRNVRLNILNNYGVIAIRRGSRWMSRCKIACELLGRKAFSHSQLRHVRPPDR